MNLTFVHLVVVAPIRQLFLFELVDREGANENSFLKNSRTVREWTLYWLFLCVITTTIVSAQETVLHSNTSFVSQCNSQTIQAAILLLLNFVIRNRYLEVGIFLVLRVRIMASKGFGSDSGTICPTF